MKTLTYTLGEKLLGHTPKPVPTGNQKLCRCGYGIAETRVHMETESCKTCHQNDVDFLEALEELLYEDPQGE